MSESTVPTGNSPNVPELSKARVCGQTVGGIAGSNRAGCMDVLSLMSAVCCQIEVSATGRSIV